LAVNLSILFSHSLEPCKVNRSKDSFKMHFSYAAAVVLAAVPSSVNGYIAARAHPTGMIAHMQWDNKTGTAWHNKTETAWVTETVTAYKTYCPSATKFTKGTKTYTATQQTWVTVTNCPNKCTISYQPAKPSIVPVESAPAKNGTAPQLSTTPTKPIP
jgi:hypothetical protein